MRTVFHVSNPEALALAGPKVRNLLADETVELDRVRVVIDDSETVTALGGESGTATELGSVSGPVDVGVCSNALAGAAVDAESLPSFVEVLSSGVGTLTRLQSDGYAYIRLLG